MTSTSISDEDLRKEIWQGSIPIRFSLAQNEVNANNSPAPFYVGSANQKNWKQYFKAIENEQQQILLPRQTYFGIVIQPVQEYFATFASLSVSTNNNAPSHSTNQNVPTDQIWLDSNGEALKWHYPVGVLFDLHANTESLPWNVTFHFHNFPSDKLFRCNTDEAIRSVFFNSLKEVSSGRICLYTTEHISFESLLLNVPFFKKGKLPQIWRL